MEQTPDASAASSPAPLSSSEYLESLTEGERQQFFESSPDERAAKMAKPAPAKPAKAKVEKAAPAESAPAEAVEPAASTEATSKAASEPADPAKPTKGLDAREEQIRQRQARLKDALAETARLEQELSARQARLQTPAPKVDAPQDSSPAKGPKAFEKFSTDPTAPKLEQYDSYDAWAIDMMDFITDRKLGERETQAQQRSAELRHQHELSTAVKTTSERVQAFAEKTPDFQTRVNPDLLNIVPISALKAGDPIGPHNFIAEQLWRSEFPGELALHFSEHPEDFQALMALNDPAAITRRIGRIEATFVTPSQPRETTPVPKTIPDADELPVVVGKKAPITIPDTEAAMKSGDFGAYERAWKRERGLKD